MTTAVTATEVVRLDGVGKRYAGQIRPAVDGVDLAVCEGEFFSLLGPSGSGKTSTLRMVAGFEAPTSGRVLLDGDDVSHVPPFRRDVNTVFQNYALFPHMTVEGNVAYPLRMRKIRAAERQRRVDEALTSVDMTGFGTRLPHQLSGGQRQRVALARALVGRPRVLLLDEPLGALDLHLRHQMQGVLKELQREVGITFIYVTHDQGEALSMSDRLAVMHHGRIEQIGPPEHVYRRPATPFVAGFVGRTNLLECAVEKGRVRFGEDLLPMEVAPAATSVTLSLRYESVSLGPPPHRSGMCQLHGTVVGSSFLGDRYETTVDVSGTTIVASTLTATSAPVPGSTAIVSFAASDLVIVGG